MKTRIKTNLVEVLVVAVVIVIGVLASYGYLTNEYYAKKLIEAIEEDDLIKLRQLLSDEKGNVNSSSKSELYSLYTENQSINPLEAACIKGNYDAIKLLLEGGANPNKIHGIGSHYSPLMIAIGNAESDNRLEIVKLLVESGADLSHFSNGRSAITIASEGIESDSIILIEYLESEGQDIYEVYSYGTILHYACRSGNSNVIKYLVSERGFDVNLRNSEGRTPLMVYVDTSFTSNKNMGDVILLLEKGADKSIIDNEGRTAFDLIKNMPGLEEYAKLLKP